MYCTKKIIVKNSLDNLPKIRFFFVLGSEEINFKVVKLPLYFLTSFAFMVMTGCLGSMLHFEKKSMCQDGITWETKV